MADGTAHYAERVGDTQQKENYELTSTQITLKHRALNCDVYSSFKEVSSDPRIVSAKICLNIRRNKTQLKLHDMTGPHSPVVILEINIH